MKKSEAEQVAGFLKYCGSTIAIDKMEAEMNWCLNYSFDAYFRLIQSFHGHAAPGLILGGKMVDISLAHLPSNILYDAICETDKCLPDAIQLLTPCTIGNGWLRIIPFGRFALSLYDKYSGEGVRVCIKAAHLDPWPEIRAWFFKLKPKQDQNPERLLHEIRTAGSAILFHEKILIQKDYLPRKHLENRTVCTLCGESYPAAHGSVCRACSGSTPYEPQQACMPIPQLALKLIPWV